MEKIEAMVKYEYFLKERNRVVFIQWLENKINELNDSDFIQANIFREKLEKVELKLMAKINDMSFLEVINKY
jgi:DNA-binding HxlR family transcriptional regulator